MDVVIEENKQVLKFFKTHELVADAIKQEIYQNAEHMIRDKAYKIKTVRGLKYRKKTIFEYKIVLNSYVKCRVAYIIEEGTVTFFYLSTDIIKESFTRQVAGLPGVEHT